MEVAGTDLLGKWEKHLEKCRIIANALLCMVAVLLVLATKRAESFVVAILPCAVVNWMISNERRLADEDPELPSVPWPTRAALFIFLPVASLAIIAFWFPVYAKDWNPWGLYAVGGFH